MVECIVFFVNLLSTVKFNHYKTRNCLLLPTIPVDQLHENIVMGYDHTHRLNNQCFIYESG